MKLNSNYEYNPELILDYLNNLTIKDKIVKYISYRFEKKNDYYELFGFQYTKINIINNHLNLYIFLNVKIDSNNIIKDIELSNKFSGSQGIKCNYNILNKHIKDLLIGEELSNRNINIKNASLLRCRHIYELLYGLSDFVTLNKLSNIDNNYYLEKTKVKIGINKINIKTEYELNNKNYILNSYINNILNLKLDNNYNIVNSNKFNIKTILNNNIINDTKIIASTKNEFYQKLLKELFKNYNKVNEYMELDNLFSFSIIMPTNYYSFLIQLVTVYNKILDKDALNKCISNYQIINGKAECLGFEKSE